MSTIKDYQKVIEILMTKNLDHKKIVENLAKENPKVFLKCCNVSSQSILEDTIARLYENEGIVPAIKEYRAQTGKGLKEFKDFVEALAQKRNLKAFRRI